MNIGNWGMKTKTALTPDPTREPLSKLLPWMENISLMEQGTVLAGLRGNDVMRAPHTKKVVRWLRCKLLQDGNPENDFMQPPDALPTGDELFEELEYMTVHYFAHFLHALEVVGYCHPDGDVASVALDYYARLVNGLHLKPESAERMHTRLSGIPGTNDDAKPWIPITREDLTAGRLCPECLEIECECEERRREEERARQEQELEKRRTLEARRAAGNRGRSGY